MIQKLFGTAKSSVVLLGSALALSSLILTGCGSGGGGSDDYSEPETTQTAPINGAATDVLVDAATVASWIASGQVGAAASFDRKVVIMDFGGYTMDPALDPERIQGSCRVATSMLTGKRFEGVGDATPLVATGEQMDDVVQRLGIDANTTIVITTAAGNPGYYVTRAYWTMRYWGFPKESLKVLDGGNTIFAADYPELMTTDVPVPVASTFSVRDLANLNDDLRASVGEMLVIVKDLPTSTTNMVYDARGDAYYNGDKATSGLIDGEVVVVDGHPEGGNYFGQGGLYVDSAYKGGKYKSAADILAMFEANPNFSADKKATVYCTSGYSATPLFFALEALLGVDVQLYDGSWSQFGKYSNFADAGGQLPPGSAWAIDQYLADTYNYNDDISSPLAIETLDAASAVAPQVAPFTGNVPANNSDVVQSQVEAADAAYAAGLGGINIVAPVATETFNDNVMIDYNTLKAWMDAGLVNAPSGEKVVIFDVTSESAYGAAHIPGAQLWNYVGQAIVRTEGPAPAVNMVLDDASIDARIQAAGVDENTTIVITSSATATYFPSRAYFLFRYWGFDKARIKVLNGYNGAWPAPDMTTTAPTVTASTLSVANLNSGVQLDTRVALAELMDAARDDRGTAIDFRGDKAATKSTDGVFSGVAGDYVVFEGRLNNGTSFSWQNFNDDYAGGDLHYKSKSEIAAEMLAAGIDVSQFSSDGSYSNPVYSYCRTGYIASTGFFVMDAIMGLDVMTYDGSWSQWGKMSDNAANGGELDNDAWATDSSIYMSIVNYNVDHTKAVEPLNPDEAALDLLPGDTAANQVENADFEYQIQATEDAVEEQAPTAGGDSGSVGC